MSQPLCRYCGKPIAKASRQVWLVTGRPLTKAEKQSAPEIGRYVATLALPNSRDQCRKFTDGAVLSISRATWAPGGGIDTFTEWDRHSYADPYFCCAGHAKQMGYAVAARGEATEAYEQALALQAEEELARRVEELARRVEEEA
jgi:hypothetical protein